MKTRNVAVFVAALTAGLALCAAGPLPVRGSLIDRDTSLENADTSLENSDEDTGVDKDSQAYLVKFGYVRQRDVEVPGSRRSRDAIKSAISRFQRMAGLRVTGKMTDATKDKMAAPRCGVSDAKDEEEERRRKRFSPSYPWQSKDLTYFIQNFSPDLSEGVQEEKISKAIKLWTDVTPLTFTRTPSASGADIVISFAEYEHGDGYAFDGQYGVLAHAFFPENGDVHMDESELWTADTYSGINMLQVMAHELGHSLGLSHSEVSEALMAPFYGGYQPNYQLHSDDVAGIQYLYGQKEDLTTPTTTTTTKTTTTTTSTSTTTPTATSTPTSSTTPTSPATPTSTTTATPSTTPTSSTTTTFSTTPTPWTTPTSTTTPSSSTTTTFSTTPTSSTTLTSTTTPNSTPPTGTTTTSSVPDLCEDASFDAITRYNRSTYFFKGSYYGLITDYLEPGYPKLIASDWPGLPNDLDSALTWPAKFGWRRVNGQRVWVEVRETRTFFFKGSLVWRYGVHGLDEGYPKPISDEFPGIPDDIGTAIYLGKGGKSLFVKDSQEYVFKEGKGVKDGFPRPLPKWRGLPDTIDAAFIWENGYKYFFSGQQYYKFEADKNKVAAGYPRSTAVWWIGCSTSARSQTMGAAEEHTP